MSYTVKLQIFEGPLDLLLSLIRKQEMDIYDIPIAEVTRQYLEYLGLMEVLNLEIAGDFLVMAATLLYIKSKALLPIQPPEEGGDEDGDDPRDELVQKLVEYQKYREAAERLREMERRSLDLFWRETMEPVSEFSEADLVEVSLFDLMEAFKGVLIKLEDEGADQVFPDEVSVVERISFIMERLEREGKLAFLSLFQGLARRVEVVVTFLALLELVKLKAIRAVQSRRFGDILLYRTGERVDDGTG